jgi:hypothetical protein
VQTVCAKGFFCPDNWRNMTKCSAGHYCPEDGACAESPCPMGTFNPHLTQTVCANCPPGTTTVDTGTVDRADCVPDVRRSLDEAPNAGAEEPAAAGAPGSRRALEETGAAASQVAPAGGVGTMEAMVYALFTFGTLVLSGMAVRRLLGIDAAAAAGARQPPLESVTATGAVAAAK